MALMTPNGTIIIIMMLARFREVHAQKGGVFRALESMMKRSSTHYASSDEIRSFVDGIVMIESASSKMCRTSQSVSKYGSADDTNSDLSNIFPSEGSSQLKSNNGSSYG